MLHILSTKERTFKFLLMMNNTVVDEGSKLHKWCDILIVVTNYSKFESETSTVCLINFKLLYECRQPCMLYLLRYQFWDTIRLGSLLIFGQKLISGVCSENVLVGTFKVIGCAEERSFIPDSRVRVQALILVEHHV